MDVLYIDTHAGAHYKAVVKSPVAGFAEQITNTSGALLILGSEMGGGAVTQAIKARARSDNVAMSVSAAATVNSNIERVRSYGIEVIEDEEAQARSRSGECTMLTFGDLEINRLQQIIEGFGVPFRFDVIGVCAQDHGVPPKGVSHLDFRHGHFKSILDETPCPHALLYSDAELPEKMTRLRSIALTAEQLPVDEVFVMDSGMAAILGASMDPNVQQTRNALVLDIATSHTVGATLQEGELFGFFEYHTKDVTIERLETLLYELANGTIEHTQILFEGGHGAYLRKSFGFDAIEIILATGPKRKLIETSRLSITLGAPLGDNMMTGTVGVLEAIRRRKGLEPIKYI